MYRFIDADELSKKIDEETFKAISAQNWDLSMGLFKAKLLIGDLKTYDFDDDAIYMYKAMTEEEQHAVS